MQPCMAHADGLGSSYPGWLKDYRNLDKFQPQIGTTVVKKPFAKFTVNVYKPDGTLRGSISSRFGTTDDYNKDINASDPTYSLTDPPPTITAYVGDTVKVDTSASYSPAGYSISQWDLQWYSPDGSNASTKFNSQAELNACALVQGLKVKTPNTNLDIYLNVRDSAPVTNGILNNSANGNHQTMDPRLQIAWYFAWVRVNVLPAPTEVQAVACYWGVNTDGSSVQLAPNDPPLTDSVTGSDTVQKTLNAKSFAGYTFKESKLSYDGSAYFDYVSGNSGMTRTVTLSQAHPAVYVYFVYSQVPPGQPSIGIDANPRSVTAGTSYSVIDLCRPSQSGTKITKWTVKEEFTPQGGGQTQVIQQQDITNASTFFKSYTKSSAGTYRYTVLSVTDDVGKSSSASAYVDVTVSSTPPPAGQPPAARIEKVDPAYPDTVITLDASGSYDPDNMGAASKGIAQYIWTIPEGLVPAAGDNPSGPVRKLKSSTVSTYTVGLTVIDSDDGMLSSTSAQVQVLIPYPNAVITYSGKFTVNHKFTCSSASSTTPVGTIDTTKTKWEVSAVSGCATSDIKYAGYPDVNTLIGVVSKDFLSKREGKIKVKLTVWNSYNYSSSTEAVFDISSDLPPVVDFTSAKKFIRDQVDSNGVHYGAHTVTDLSFSPDGDTIGRRQYYYTYDSDNDGDFNDELAAGRRILFYDGTAASATANLYDVGCYRMDMQVYEVLDSTNSIPEFISPDDVKSNSTFWITQ